MEILAPPFARRGRPGSVYADAGNVRPAPLRLGSRRTPPSPGGLRNAALIVAMTTKTRFLATATWPCFRYPTSISPSSTRDPESAERRARRMLLLCEQEPAPRRIFLLLRTRTTHPNGIVCHFRIV
jgi:hypothetical protein